MSTPEQPEKESLRIHGRAWQWAIENKTSDGKGLYDSGFNIHAQEAIRWMSEFTAAEVSQLQADLTTACQERDKLLVALEEESVDDAISQIESDNRATIAIAEEIKRLEQWPPNSWPSMHNRWVYAALFERAEQAEAVREALQEQVETVTRNHTDRVLECHELTKTLTAVEREREEARAEIARLQRLRS